jgi:UDP-glucose 4-epimerase
MSARTSSGRELLRALVTGGCGFLGSWVVEILVRDGVDVTVLDRAATPAVEPPPRVELIRAELPAAPLDELLAQRGIDTIFHFVGTPTVPPSVERPLDDLVRNTESTLAVLEAARRLDPPPLVLFTSSAAVYGESVMLPMAEDHPLRPISPYGISKLAGEQYVGLYARMHEIPGFSVRPFSLYGPRQRKLVVYDLLTRIDGGEDPLVVLGSPDVGRDFVYAGDAAEMLVELAKGAPAQGETYNIASGATVSLGELVGTLVELAEQDLTIEFTGSVRPGDPHLWLGDPARAAALGARTSTPLREGLVRTIDWFRAEVAATQERMTVSEANRP